MKKENELTIVTAFYKLDLEQKSIHSYKSQRNIDTYLNYFAFNAGLKNKFVIYCNDDYVAQKVLEFRAQHNLESKTKIIQKPLISFARDDFAAINEVFERYNQSKWRADGGIHPPHTSALYDYLMYLKSFFVVDSINNAKDFVSENLLWLDFGFNFAGSYFMDSNDFDFTLMPQREMPFNAQLINVGGGGN